MTSKMKAVALMGIAMALSVPDNTVYQEDIKYVSGPNRVSKKKTQRKSHNQKLHSAFAHVVTKEEREAPKIGRNEICPCGSGLKYKKCCLK